jgi:mRNA interferase MazF
MARGLSQSRVHRGEIWFHSFAPPDKRRPVLVLSREGVLPLIRTVIVAPITSSIRGLPSEVQVGIEEGLKHPSAVNLDHVQTVEQRDLRQFVGSLGPEKMEAVCRALNVATGCGD